MLSSWSTVITIIAASMLSFCYKNEEGCTGSFGNTSLVFLKLVETRNNKGPESIITVINATGQEIQLVKVRPIFSEYQSSAFVFKKKLFSP